MAQQQEWNACGIRKEFPMLSRLMHGKTFVYLDTAATAQKPRCVIEAIRRFYAEEYATVHRSVYDFASQATDKYDRVRLRVQRFLNAAHREEIIFTKGTTEGLNLIASSFGKAFVQTGDEIVITASEHHSNIVPWQILCRERGAHLKVIPINDRGELVAEEWERQLSEKTRLVSVAHIANTTGTLHPIEEIIRLAHAKGAVVCIDGAQSAAHRPVDVQALDADFYVFSGHKAYGPTGVGVLYGKKALLNAMPPYQSGGDMIDRVTLTQTTFAGLPEKFEAGTPLIAEVMGLGAALEFIESLGRERIAAWEQELLKYATPKLEAIKGVRLIGTAPKKGGIISLVVDGLHALDLGTLLDLKGIAIRTGQMCAEPTLAYFHAPSLLRLSFGVHTTREEIDFFVNALREAILLLRPALSY